MSLKIALIIGFILLTATISADECPSFFTKNNTTEKCTVRQCLNGGYLNSDKTICICPSGYLGIHCEAVKTSMPPDRHFVAGGTSFNIMNINLYTQYWGFQTYENIRKSVTKHFSSFNNGYNRYNLLETKGSPGLDPLGEPQNNTYDFEPLVNNTSEFSLSNATDTGLYWCYEVPIYEKLISMIQEASLKNTVITIITQHPPSNDKLYQARETAIAFGIRINVLWISDVTFNKCEENQISAFKTFVDVTGGLFVQLRSELDDEPTQNLVSQVLLTHYKPQYVSIQSFPDCSKPQAVPVAIDPTVNGPYNFVFLGSNASPDINSFRSCLLRQPLRSVDSQLAIFQSPDPTCTSLNVTATGACTAIVFTNANATVGPLDLAIYTTYVEDKSIDASRYAIIENVPFYPALHVESSSGASITFNSISVSYDTNWKSTPTLRYPAAFEWISNNTIKCDAIQTYSLFLNISVGSTIVQRAVRIPCVATPTLPPPSTFAPTTDAPPTSESYTSASPSTSSAPITSTVSSSSTSEYGCTPKKNYATFLFAYATDFDSTTYGLISKTIGNIVSYQLPMNQTLANKLIDRATPENINYTSNPLDFTTNCIVDQPVATLSSASNVASDVLSAIRELLTVSGDKGRLEGSMMLILVNRLPSDTQDLSDDEYDQLTNLNIKIFPIITIKNLVGDAASFGRSGAVFNRIAAQTNGHYVVANDTIGRDVNSDINKIVVNFMQTAYTQNLLFTRNVGVARSGTNLGILRVPNSPNGTVPITITVSLSAVDVNIPQAPTRLFLGIKPNGNTTQTVSIDFLNNAEFTNSNYYTTTVNLEAGVDRELFLIYVAGPDQNDLLIRMWTFGDVYREASYLQYSESTNEMVSNINENIGAALRLKLDKPCLPDGQATLLITDCNGVVSAKYDSDQSFNFNPTTDNFFQFVPFFCSSQPTPTTCILGAESKYDAQFIFDTFSVMQSFQCRPGPGAIDNCKLQDSNGNNQCAGSSPFLRGPTGSLYDCSNHGRLVYDELSSKFRCQCDHGFDGLSCEVVSCSSPNNDPLATDNSYHTYTVVIGLDTATSPLAIDDGQELFGLGSLSFANLSNVWKYQLLTICADGAYDMIYSGSDLSEFQRLFRGGYVSFARPCNVLAEDGVHDLTDIYQRSVEGVGRNVKGIIVYFSEVSKMINVTLGDFISASQSYQQQLFVYAVDGDDDITTLNNSDAIVQAAMSTGGFLIQSNINNLPSSNIDDRFIPALLGSSSSIAWYSSSQSGSFTYNTIDPTATSFVVTWKAGDEFVNQNTIADKCRVANNTYSSCKLTGSKTLRGIIDGGASFYVAVYVLADIEPSKAQIISSLSQDSSDAVSTSSSDGRTMITFNIPKDFTVVANDGDNGITRNAKRNNCTFGWTAYSVFTEKKYLPGANIAKITIQNPDGSRTFTRFFPFGTSSAPICKNGGTPMLSTGSCKCASGFQGSDCSLVNCLENSTSNAWSDVCVCASIDDVACANQYTSVF